MKRFIVTVLSALVVLFATVAANDKAGELKLQQAIDLIESKGDLAKATPLLESVATSPDRALAARGLLCLARAQERYGQADAQKTYARLVNDFADQPTVVAEARNAMAGSGAQTRRSERRLWTDTLMDATYVVSPTGDKVAAIDEWSNRSNLFVRNVGGGAAVNLTNFTADWQGADHVVWSPDGRQIAYQFYSSDDGTELRTVDVKSKKTRAVPNSHRARQTQEPSFVLFDWSADGRSLLVDVQEPRVPGQLLRTTSAIAWVSIDTGAVQPVVKSATNWTGAKVSPDGQFIAFSSRSSSFSASGEVDVQIMSAAGGPASTVIDWPGPQSVVAWLSDGRLVFMGVRLDRSGLWVLPVKNGLADGAPSFVRETTGRTALYVSVTRKGAILDVVHPEKTQVVITGLHPGAAGSAANETLDIPVKGFSNASWSPDGAFLIWTEPGTRGLPSIYVWSAEQRSVRVIPTVMSSIGSISDPIWTPDRRQVLLSGIVSKEQAMYRVDVKSGSVARVTTPVPMPSGTQAVQARAVAMTPDERFYLNWIVRLNDPVAGRSLSRVDAQTGVETELIRNDARGGMSSVGSVSPDGKWWAYLEYRKLTEEEAQSAATSPTPTRLMAVPVAGGPPRTLCSFTLPKGSRLGGGGGVKYKWSADSNSLFFVVWTGDLPSARYEIWECQTTSGETRGTGIVTSGSMNFAIHPDGRRLVYTSSTREAAEIWLYEGFVAPKGGSPRR